MQMFPLDWAESLMHKSDKIALQPAKTFYSASDTFYTLKLDCVAKQGSQQAFMQSDPNDSPYRP